jgi:hypothetical protein
LIGRPFENALAAVEDGTQPPKIGNDVVNIVAVVLGEHLRAASGLESRICPDEMGRSCACTALPRPTRCSAVIGRQALGGTRTELGGAFLQVGAGEGRRDPN